MGTAINEFQKKLDLQISTFSSQQWSFGRITDFFIEILVEIIWSLNDKTSIYEYLLKCLIPVNPTLVNFKYGCRWSIIWLLVVEWSIHEFSWIQINHLMPLNEHRIGVTQIWTNRDVKSWSWVFEGRYGQHFLVLIGKQKNW